MGPRQGIGALRAGGGATRHDANTRHLAQFNIARIKYPLDDPRMAEFVDNVARVNGLAETIEGFVWRLQDDSGNAMNMRVYDDPRVLPNLTLWEKCRGAGALRLADAAPPVLWPPRRMVRTDRNAAGAVVCAGRPSAEHGGRRRAA